MSDGSEWSYSPRLLAIIFGLFILGRGFHPGLYGYAISNQTNQFPLIRHTLNPTYLAADWTVAARTGLGSPRFFYTQFVAVFVDLLGFPTAIFLLYLLSTVVILAAAYRIITILFNDRLVAVLSIGAIISPLTGVIHLGGNMLVKSYLIPSHLANALILVGLYWTFQRRYRPAFGILGVATLFHIVNGFWMSVVAGVCAVAIEAWSPLRDGDIREAIDRVPWGGAAIYGAISLIGVVPILVENAATDAGWRGVYLMAWVRHPHHYIPSTWPVWQLILVIVFIIVAVGAMVVFGDRLFADTRAKRVGLAWAAALVVVSVVGWLSTEVIPVEFLIKLQPYHVDDFLFLILYGAVLAFGVKMVEQVLLELNLNPSTVIQWGTTATLVVVLVVASMIAGFGVVDGPDYGTDVQSAYEWIETETPQDAVFIASPTQEGFRWESSRAMVVNIKSFPFRPEAMAEWGKRIGDICDLDQPLTHDALDQCGLNYETLPESTIKEQATEYDACWMLTTNRSYSFDRRFSNDEYVVYHLDDVSGC